MADPDPKAVPLTPASNAASAVPPLGAAPATVPAGPPIYAGSVSHWMAFQSYAAATIILIIGLVALIFGSLDHFDPIQKLGKYAAIFGKIGIVGGVALLVAAAIMILYIYMSVRANRYTVTTRLIERETGIVVKKVDALDLGRVKHVDMKQTFMERVLNVGTIEVYSGDREEPMLLIEDIPNPRPVYEKLRDAVIDLSRRRGIIVE